MISKTAITLLAALLFLAAAVVHPSAAQAPSGPEYTGDAQLKFPGRYRQWVYLTTGFDMSYNPTTEPGQHVFDNLFVNPEAYNSFLETGTWPDKTMLVLENREAKGKGSINQAGNYQGSEVTGVEVHVKDEARFPGKWAFFIFDNAKTAKMVPTEATCYTCHADHAAVDTTFVQ